jgi:hypothetical protein
VKTKDVFDGQGIIQETFGATLALFSAVLSTFRPIGGMSLFKTLLDLLFPSASISSKSDLNAIVIGYFL